MDIRLQHLRRTYAQTPTFASAMELAGALLQIETLDHYIEAALAGDLEARGLLRYMRTRVLGEQYFQEIEDSPDRPRFLAPEPDRPPGASRIPVGGPYQVKYINVYCGTHVFASVEVDLVDDAIRVLNLLSYFYQTQSFAVPPHPAEVMDGHVAGMLEVEQVMSVGVYKNTPGKIRIAIENKPSFDFSDEDAMPPLPTRGQRDIRLRPVTEDDLSSGDYGDYLRKISYEDLPDFAKPEGDAVPTYVMASQVTRGSVQDIDGPAWVDFYQPIAKIYVGYLVNYLITSPAGWEWWDKGTVYTYICRHTAERARQLSTHEGFSMGQEDVPMRAPARLLVPCPLAGIPQFLAQKPRRHRCRECGSDVDIELHESRQLALREDAPPETPEPPDYLNQILDFLERLYQDEIFGDIGSVLGGQDLRIYLSEGSYGPV